jgi:hypothetical protein
VLVIGEAGWESKFVIAALEEEGWKVDAELRVAPGVSETQGSLAVIDTSRYSAVVALDSAATPHAFRIVDFVRTGGGVILAPAAAALSSLAPLRAGAAASANADARLSQPAASVTLATLPLTPITSLVSDAVRLQERGGATTVAAKRYGAGRSLQIGYADTWRWRLSGGDRSIREHRAWWAGLVSSVAYAPLANRPGAETSARIASMTSEAPFADLVAAVGPASSTMANATVTQRGSNWRNLLYVLLVLALLGETASRRQRGTA